MEKYDLCIASDHAGYKLKAKIIKHLDTKYPKMKIADFGTDSDESVDYPDYTKKICDAIIEGTAERGVLICGTGIGMSIAANRNSDIRAALCLTEYMAEKSRQHNNANILILGSKLIEDKLTLKILDIFLESEFEGGRHSRRLAKIT